MCEMEDLVDIESISQDDMSALLEICEPLHVTEEKAHLDCRAPASRRPSALVVPTGTRPRDEHGLRQYSSIESTCSVAYVGRTHGGAVVQHGD